MRLFSLLSRYVSRLFLTSFFIVLGCISIIIALFDFADLQRRTSFNDNISFLIKLKLVLLKLPSLLELVLPFAIFISALFTFWRMNRSNELTVTRAAGISLWQIINSISLTACLIGFIDLTIFNSFSSSLLKTYDRYEDRYIEDNQGEIKVSDTGLWLLEKNKKQQKIYHISRVNFEDFSLEDANIFIFDSSNAFYKRINAKKAFVKQKELKLIDVWEASYKEVPIYSKEKIFPSSLTMDLIKNTTLKKSLMSFWTLPQYINILDLSGLHSLKYKMYWHGMISNAFLGGTLVLLAAAFMCRPYRINNTFLSMIIGLISGFSLYFLKNVTYALGKSGSLPCIIAAWVTPCIAMLVGVSLLLYQEEA